VLPKASSGRLLAVLNHFATAPARPAISVIILVEKMKKLEMPVNIG
jgi:hypothetical protein